MSGGVKQGCGGENKLFSSFMRQYLENDTRSEIRPKLLVASRKLLVRFRVGPRSMTLDDLELL